MSEQQQTSKHRIAVVGGTGFIGRAVCRRLSAQGHSLQLITRRASRHADLEKLPGVRLVEGAVGDQGFLARALAGSDVAINLAGILNEGSRSGQDFRAVHVDLTRAFGRACRDAGVARVLHMSALGARAGSAPSRYLRSKGEGGNALQVELGSRIPWTIFRPSIVFGPGDDFTNRFARLLRVLPGAVPLPCPNARMAPVYVEDVAIAFARAIDEPASHRLRYALCGPREYSLREIVALVAETTNRPRRIVGLPDGLSRFQARLLELFPSKPFSRDNYLSLQVDSICDPAATGDRDGMAELGITPGSMEELVPQYLGR